MHCQLLLALIINTRKVRQKDIENNNHISNKDKDKRNKKRRSKKDMTRKYDHRLGTTKYNEKENIPWHCHNIIYKERICTNDKYHKEKNERKETLAQRWQQVELYKQRSSLSASPQKSEKIWFWNDHFFYPTICLPLFQSWYQKVNRQFGRVELYINSCRRNIRIRPRRFVRFNFFPFPFEQL